MNKEKIKPEVPLVKRMTYTQGFTAGYLIRVGRLEETKKLSKEK